MTLIPTLTFSLFLLASSSVVNATERADTKINGCPEENASLMNYLSPPEFPDEQLGNTNISAVQVENTEGSNTLFSGEVLIERHLLRLRADSVLHNTTEKTLSLTGSIHVDTESMALEADSGLLNLGNNSLNLLQSQFAIQQSKLSGISPEFIYDDQHGSLLTDSMFTTCSLTNPDWHLNTASLELDTINNIGTATHTLLWVKGVPVFYFPWIQFPLGDQRRSGLLMPGFSRSSSNGFELSLPWYWNIAPNQDATITPRHLKKRGNMLDTSYRFLTKSTEGTARLEYIEDDALFQDKRHSIHWKSSSHITKKLKLDLLSNRVSDEEFLQDFGNDFSTSNTSRLERHARLSYNLDNWKISLKAQAFQTLDDSIALSRQPYRRLPQLTIKGSENLFTSDNYEINASLDSEWVDFEHTDETKTQGTRQHHYPELKLSMQGNAWFLKPAIGLMHTQYDVQDAAKTKIDIDDRSLSVVSLDSGVFFERELNNGDFIQTLEPRLFYLKIPYEEQSTLPLFDTSLNTFNFNSLFSKNRFNGIDRIGDTNQVTLAISSRLINHEGHETLSLALGRMYYFEDQQVSLNTAADTRNSDNDTSDYIGEVSGRYQDWYARANLQWDTELKQADRRSFQLNYAASNKSIFNLAYRYSRNPANELNTLEQSDISFAWPITSSYSLLGQWNYSLTEERDISTLFGIEYESCCWALRLVSQRYLIDNDDSQDYDLNILFQFVLKGFGSIADKQTTNTLKHAILGYQPDY